MKKLLLMALGFASLTLASCKLDNVDRHGSDGDSFKLRYRVEGQTRGATRATVDPVDGENTVHSLYLLFFSPSSDRTGTYQGFVEVQGPFEMNQDISLSNLGASGLDATAAYKVLAVANIDQYAPYLGVTVSEWLGQLTDQTENYAYKQLVAFIKAENAIENDKILMTGETSKESGGLTTMQLTLTRGVIRFDVANSARDSYDLLSVSIWNAFPETSLFGGGLVDYSKNRIQRFYGIDNNNYISAGDYYDDMFGGLYSFPNQVINPEDNDTKTTCLIVGLQKKGESKTTYHRVNISAQDAMQNLKANNSYRLTIRSVTGHGADTEIEAYTGGVNNITYKINYWDLDDDGLIQQNGNIILGIPTKRIKMGAEAEDRSYDIFAFGGAPGEQIRVSSSFEGNAGSYITVTQKGNTIAVEAEALATSEERIGTITITYAGLTATIGIIQSGTAGKFLRVATPNGTGIPSYPGFAGVPMNGTLNVEASGNWTATLYQFGGSDYFSFSNFGPQTTLSSTALSATLPIFTSAENTTGASRNAFVLISLDDDPDNYNSALVLSQKAKGKIAISPSPNLVEWNGLGTLITTGGINTTDYRFTVSTTVDEGKFVEWEAAITEGDTYFEVVGFTWDPDVAANNVVTVRAKGEAATGTQTGNLRVYIKNDSGTYVDIPLKQSAYTLTITPNTFSAITSKGGSTDPITLTTNGSGLTWSAEITSTTAASGTMAATHIATIVDPTSDSELSQGTKYALNQTFRVKFPKIYYGDHKKGIVTASITVKLWSGATEVGTQTFKVTQNPLLPNSMNIANYHGTAYNYGNFYSTSNYYNRPLRDYLRTLFTTGGTDIDPYPATPGSASTRIYTPNTVTLPTSGATSTSISSSVTYVHASQANVITATGVRTAIENWRKQDNGVLVVLCDQHASGSRPFFTPLITRGWSSAGDADVAEAKRTRHTTNAKIIDFIYNRGPFGVVDPNDSTVKYASIDNPWFADGSSEAVNITGADGAVAILGSDSRASIVIDPVNRIVFMGEGQFFASGEGYRDATINSSVTTAKSKLLANICAYIVLTSQYGSSFSDTLVGPKE